MSDIRSLLLRHEALRLKPYLDSVGKITIGIGRNLEDRGISPDEAMHLFENDLTQARREAASAFPWFKDLSDVRQDVVISMIFNMGMPRFMEFKKMISALASGDFDRASNEMLASKWASQVKRRAVELADMMRTDQYQQ